MLSDGFFKFLANFANAKGIVVLVVAVGFIVWYGREFGSPQITIGPTPAAVEQAPTPGLRAAGPPDTAEVRGVGVEITRLDLTPVSFELPAYFLVAVKNTSPQSGHFDVSLDVGASTIQRWEARPAGAFEATVDTTQGIITGRFSEIEGGQTVFLYALLDRPSFREFVVRGCCRRTVRTMEDVGPAPRESRRREYFENFLMIVASFIVAVAAVIFVVQGGLWVERWVSVKRNETGL